MIEAGARSHGGGEHHFTDVRVAASAADVAAIIEAFVRSSQEAGFVYISKAQLQANYQAIANAVAKVAAERAADATLEVRVANAVKSALAGEPLDVRVVGMPARESVTRKVIERGVDGLISAVIEHSRDEDA